MDRKQMPIETGLADNPISINALKVVRRLSSQGYEAYLVGGCVRDLLLGRAPKDFDVATNAHPDEVGELFKNSRPIGRRFKIVHVRYGRDIIEVATFRAPHADNSSNTTDTGLILSDNSYGSFSEDVFRRDFTVNALYYDADTKEIRDLVDGLSDIDAQVLRLIGDPESRYREDPVRMLRAVRFKAKLGFTLSEDTEEPLRKIGHLLQDIPPARLFEEMLKLFMSGYGEKAFEILMEYELFGWLFPDSKNAMAINDRTKKLIALSLASTDKRIAEEKPVTPAFVFAALLWHPFEIERDRLKELGDTNAAFEAAGNVIGKQQFFTSIPKRFSGPMREIWQLQSRLGIRTGKKPEGIVIHRRFRAAYDFLLIRELSGENLEDLGQWWTDYQEQNPEQRAEMTRRQPKTSSNRRRKRRPPKKPENADG
ncbi:MAG: poly(A) polymerase [Flavobacterium sp.]|jgi:poly(A) polymerase